MRRKKTGESLTKLAEAAFLKAAEQVIEQAERTGTPIIVWEDGAVKRLQPSEARKRLAEHRETQ